MMLYLAIVAIVNLLIGFAAAWVLCSSANGPAATLIHWRWSRRGVLAGLPTEDVTGKSAPARPVQAVAAPSNLPRPVMRKSHQAALHSQSVTSPCTDAARELHQIAHRLQYCRSNPDKTLLKQLSTQLLDWTVAWHSHLLQWIESPEQAPPEVFDGDALDLEMQAAQSETTQSNLRAIDWDESIEELVRQLEREIESLDRNRRLKKLAAQVAESA